VKRSAISAFVLGLLFPLIYPEQREFLWAGGYAKPLLAMCVMVLSGLVSAAVGLILTYLWRLLGPLFNRDPPEEQSRNWMP